MLCGLVFRRGRYYEDSVKCSLSLFITKAADQELCINKFLRNIFFRCQKKKKKKISQVWIHVVL